MSPIDDCAPPAWLLQIPAGKLDLRIFDQDVYWVTANGQVLRLDSMSQSHLAAVLSMVERQALRIHFHVLANVALDVLDAFEIGTHSAEALLFDLTGQCSADATPHQWLNSTPLVRQIRALHLPDR